MMKTLIFPLPFGAVANAASWNKAVHGAERVAVVDIDVHHGNGTQALFRADPTTFYASTHQVPAHDRSPLYTSFSVERAKLIRQRLAGSVHECDMVYVVRCYWFGGEGFAVSIFFDTPP